MASSILPNDSQPEYPERRRSQTDLRTIFMLGTNSCSVLGPVYYLAGVGDLANLGQVNKALSRLCRDNVVLKKLCRRNLERVLHHFNLLYEEGFCTILRSSKSILSGSMLLHCATGDPFVYLEKSDLDIYVPYDMADTVEKHFVVECGYNRILERNGRIRIPQSKSDLNRLFDKYESLPLISRVIRLTLSYHTIDLVIMDQGVPPKAAVAQFDFSFLMSFFDGNSFHMWFPGDIINKTGFFNEVYSKR
jgi:hypothetical protein